MGSTLRHISFRRLGTTDVHQRYLDDDRDLCALLGRRARDLGELLRRAPTGAGRLVPRQALVRAFTAYATRHGAPAPVLENAAALADPKVHCVVTGQQPGLGGGPLFNLFKVATAIRLCRAIEAHDSSVRAVPVFWNHSDDHDLEEANRLFLVNGAQDVQRIRLELDHTGSPLREIRCGREVQRALDEVDQLLPQSEQRQWAMDLFKPRHPDETLGDAQARMMFELFGEDGLLVIEPRDLPEEAFAPLERWWSQADTIRDAVRQTCDEIGDRGLDVTMDPSATMMFEIVGDRRNPLADGERYRRATGLSPGALLRPLWQDACLPTLAFVVGPGELSYLAVVAPLYRALGVPQPPFVPRASMTLVEPSLQRLLAKFGWDLVDLEQPPEKLIEQLGGDEAGGVEGDIEDLAAVLRQGLDRIAGRLQHVDSSLLAAVDRVRTKTGDELQRLAQKLRSARQNREGTGMRQIRRLCANLRPRGRTQERVLGPLPFLAVHGKELARTILAAAEPFTVEHGVLEL
ncbi:MAG: bacillithiol biosynthesis BshC [Planctomycetota bacterium]